MKIKIRKHELMGLVQERKETSLSSAGAAMLAGKDSGIVDILLERAVQHAELQKVVHALPAGSRFVLDIGIENAEVSE